MKKRKMVGNPRECVCIARQLSQVYTFDGYKLQKGVDSGIAPLLRSGVYTFLYSIAKV